MLELITGGELFDLVALGGALSENTARFFFKQLVDGLAYMHAAGITHRDIKPENLMLDSACDLKIADFGMAGPIVGRDGSGLLHTQLGTETYMAPELHLKRSYQGDRIDLFASAVILFTIVTQRPPFTRATLDDELYRLIAGGRPELFWKCHAQGNGCKDIYSPEFKDLFESIVQLNPKRRPKIADLQKHPWMTNPNLTRKEEIIADFARRKALIDEEAFLERELKREERRLKAKGSVRRSSKRPENEEGFLD